MSILVHFPASAEFVFTECSQMCLAEILLPLVRTPLLPTRHRPECLESFSVLQPKGFLAQLQLTTSNYSSLNNS